MRKKENARNCPFENEGICLVIYSIFPKLFLGMKILQKIKNLGCFLGNAIPECAFGKLLGDFWEGFL